MFSADYMDIQLAIIWLYAIYTISHFPVIQCFLSNLCLQMCTGVVLLNT